MEQAIKCCENALQIRTREALPYDWASAQNNLGSEYSKRILGNKAESLEQSIKSFENALLVFTQETFPYEWARSQVNLGNAYGSRILGDQAENLEQAIDCYKNALKVYSRTTFPQKWAQTQQNLGTQYRTRIRDNPAKNLEKAITCLQKSLQVYTHDRFPENWAGAQTDLGTIYCDRILGDRAENMERAIACHRNALQVYTFEKFPESWAMAQHNLAVAYRNRILGEPTENIKQAITCYENSVRVYSRKAFPQRWAGIQNNLIVAYGEMSQINKAMEHFRLAVEVYTPTAFPVECLGAGRNFGQMAFAAGLWTEAAEAYHIAIEAVEQSRSWVSADQRKQEILAQAITIYHDIVQACINTNKIDKAIEYVERSKARNLVELLATRDLYPKGDIPETVINELSRLRREIDAEQRRLEIQQTNRNSNGGTISGERSLQINSLQTTSRDSTNLTQLRQQLDELLVRDIKPIDPDFLLTQEVKSIFYSDIQSLTAENTAILEWYILGDKFLTFIITPQSPTPIVWQSLKTDFQALVNWGNEYLRDYQEEDKTQWRENLAPRLQSLSEILHINEILERVPKHCDQLILIPHRFLHLFPLHALPVSREIWQRFNRESPSPEPPNPCLLDCFKQGVSYSPSCQLLQQAQRRKRPNFTHLFAVQNPTNDLKFTDLEVPAISQHFHPKDILVKNDAKKSVIDDSRLRIAHCAHFSCHGYFNFKQPLLSALLLADCELPPPPPEENPTRYLPLRNGKTLDLTKCLTLADIFALDFRECRLVVLSACETGISDFNSISDEYISLPSGFLVAGSSNVVPTLWAVNDLSTSFLMIKFYQLLKAGLSVSLALNSAQLWLRDATKEDLQAWTKQLPLHRVEKTTLYDMLKKISSKEIRPFQSPYHWAAFCSVGQ